MSNLFSLKGGRIGKPKGIYPKGSVIYRIKNLLNNKGYIGQTKNFRKRLNNHSMYLNKGTHCNSLLQRAFNKYGCNCFIIEILEYVTLENLTEREQYWCDFYESYNRDKGYNFLIDVRSPWYGPKSEEHKRKIGMSNRGGKRSKETRHKMSIARIGRFKGKENPCSKSIIQYTKNMEIKGEYFCVREATESTGISKNSITNNLCGLSKSAGGFIWKFKK